MFEDFPVAFLLLTSSLIPLWSENILCMISAILRSVCFLVAAGRRWRRSSSLVALGPRGGSGADCPLPPFLHLLCLPSLGTGGGSPSLHAADTLLAHVPVSASGEGKLVLCSSRTPLNGSIKCTCASEGMGRR